MDEILSSVGRVRIIHILASEGEINITALSKKTGLNHTYIQEHLKELQRLNIVELKRFGRIRIYQLHPTNKAAERLGKFFKQWNNQTENFLGGKE